jgi:hypothetical protein
MRTFGRSYHYPRALRNLLKARRVSWRLVRDHEDRTGIDLAENVAVFARRGVWSIEKVGAPNNRKRRGGDAHDLYHLRGPPGFHLRPEHLKWLRGSDARNVEIRSHNTGDSDSMIACNTVDEFVRLTI